MFRICLILIFVFAACSFKKNADIASDITAYDTKYFEIKWNDGSFSASSVIKENEVFYSADFLSVPEEASSFELKIPKIEGIIKANQVSLKISDGESVTGVPLELNTSLESGFLIKALIDYSKIFLKSRDNQLHVSYGNRDIIIKLKRLPKKYSLKEIDRQELSSYFSFPVDKFSLDTNYYLLKSFALTNNESEKIYINVNSDFEEKTINVHEVHKIDKVGKCAGKGIYKYSNQLKNALTINNGKTKLIKISGDASKDLMSPAKNIEIEAGNTVFLGLYYDQVSFANIFGYPNRGIQSDVLIKNNTSNVKVYTDCCEHIGYDGGARDIRLNYNRKIKDNKKSSKELLRSNYRCGRATYNTGVRSLAYKLITDDFKVTVKNSNSPRDQVFKAQNLLPSNEEILLWKR